MLQKYSQFFILIVLSGGLVISNSLATEFNSPALSLEIREDLLRRAKPLWIQVKLEQLHCEACGQTIRKALEKDFSVESLSIDLNGKSLLIAFPSDSAPDEGQLTEAIESVGYRVIGIGPQ